MNNITASPAAIEVVKYRSILQTLYLTRRLALKHRPATFRGEHCTTLHRIESSLRGLAVTLCSVFDHNGSCFKRVASMNNITASPAAIEFVNHRPYLQTLYLTRRPA